MPRSYPPGFRRKVLDLVATGRKVAEVARLLGISDQTIYVWRRQHLIDTGQLPGTTSSDMSELHGGAVLRSRCSVWRLPMGLPTVRLGLIDR